MTSVSNPFFAAFEPALKSGEFLALILSSPQRSAKELPKKQSVRSVLIRGQTLYQWELQFEKQQTHLNLTTEQTCKRVEELFGMSYRNANLFTTQEDVIARVAGGGVQLRRQPASRTQSPAPVQHDRTKEYLIPDAGRLRLKLSSEQDFLQVGLVPASH